MAVATMPRQTPYKTASDHDRTYKTMTETLSFQTEVKQLLQLMIQHL